ncbi:MAG: hypothetical protein ACXVPN_03580 [Bacteroidia bacterium]
MESNREIENTLNSLEGIERADIGPLFYDKVMNRIENGEAKVVSIAPRVLWQAAAGFAFLIALNIVVLLRNGNSKNLQAQDNNNPLAKEYFSYFSNTQF